LLQYRDLFLDGRRVISAICDVLSDGLVGFPVLHHDIEIGVRILAIRQDFPLPSALAHDVLG